MIIAVYTETEGRFAITGQMALSTFLDINHELSANEISVIHSHLNNVGEYIGGGGAAPYFKLERMVQCK